VSWNGGTEVRIGDYLYFAPEIRFRDLDLNGDKLPNQFRTRLEGFYLDPAEREANAGNAFASCVLILTCIDGLAFFQTGSDKIKKRFRNWCLENLRDVITEGTVDSFYDVFRNGLVHNVAVKHGSAFDLTSPSAVEFHGDIITVNPILLLQHVRQALVAYVKDMMQDKGLRKELSNRIQKFFKVELENV
jgi:hypothetical protein